MIFTLIIKGFFLLVDWIVSLFPYVSPHAIFTDNAWITFNDLIFDNLGLIDLIIPLSLLKALFIGMFGFMVGKLTIDAVMFIIRKIPLVSMV